MGLGDFVRVAKAANWFPETIEGKKAAIRDSAVTLKQIRNFCETITGDESRKNLSLFPSRPQKTLATGYSIDRNRYREKLAGGRI